VDTFFFIRWAISWQAMVLYVFQDLIFMLCRVTRM
jgi:hypothetical protein